ncbi:MAG: hypothetical protein NWF14_07030 [Candidatus Bathyarchaeota archaeon]|nr:hypothetical protein [Candidatus Bathyarchaeota archaeon]
MATAKKPKRLGQEELRRVIEFCQSVENKGLNPFLVEVDDLIAVIKEYFPSWENPEDLCLDAEALNQIASVIKMQSEWIKHRATSLYRDPFLVEEKLRSLHVERIAEIFLESWHPIVELEQISPHSLDAAMKYWDALEPLDERWLKADYAQMETETTTREELVRQGILSDETFSSELERLWSELKEAAGRSEKVRYWDFVGAETYDETVRRAYLTSFLVTYGYAALEVHPLEEEIFIQPFEKPVSKEESQLFSFPISISYGEWKQWREGRGA